jgi:hypothetical protein
LISYITTYRCNLHAYISLLHFVNVLGEDTTLLVLKVTKVNFYEQIYVASVSHFRHWVVVSDVGLTFNISLKL